MDEFTRKVGRNIKKLRRDKGLSQRELTQNKMSPGFLSQIERGLTSPSLNSLRIIARNLQVSTSDLLPREYETEDDSDPEMKVLFAISEAHFFMGGQSDFLNELEQRKAKFEKDDLSARKIDALIKLHKGMIKMNDNAYDDTFNYLTAAAKKFEDLSELSGIIQCLLALGEMHLSKNNALLAVRFFETVNRRLDDVKHYYYSKYNMIVDWGLARAYQMMNETETADEILSDLMERLAEQADPHLMVNEVSSTSLESLSYGDESESINFAGAARALSAFHYMRWMKTEALYTLGLVAENEGDRQRALTCLDNAEKKAEEMRSHITQARALQTKGKIYLRQGHLESAFDAAEKAMKITSKKHQPTLHGLAALLAGKVAAASEDLGKAEEYLKRAEECFRYSSEISSLAKTQSELGEVLIKANKREEALKRFQRASDLFSKTSSEHT